MATGQLTSAWSLENFYSTTLSADVTASATDIFLNTVPVGSEGTLVINPDSATGREIIYYNSKTATKVTCPSAALGRGYDNTTATSHTAGTKVIMAPVADWFNSLRTLFTTTPQGWTSVGATPTAVTALGNRSYSLSWASSISATRSVGMRNKYTRTVTAPTQCTDLESGSSQYFSKTTPAGMTFTDDFVVSAWVKLESYKAVVIASRYNGTSGWSFELNASGQLIMVGFNAGVGNNSQCVSYQSVPLNKWVHVAGQLDMSAFTATTTTSYIMIDGVDVPASVNRAGTNPVTLVQAGNFEVGSKNAGDFFDGKIAQVAIYSAKVTQATILASMNQGLSGSETSLISAYSFNNTINDLNATNANNLTANGSAVATNLDTPFTQTQTGITAGTTNYSITTAISSDGLTETVQVPEGDTIPTSGGVSAVSYSVQKVPYGFPVDKGRWRVETVYRTDTGGFSVTALDTWSISSAHKLTVPTGSWAISWQGTVGQISNVAGSRNATFAIASSAPANGVYSVDFAAFMYNGTMNQTAFYAHLAKDGFADIPASTAYSLYCQIPIATGIETFNVLGTRDPLIIRAECAYL